MAHLTNEAAGTIFRHYGAWFGAPALLRKHPSQFSLDPSKLCEELSDIIDGSIRFGAIVSQNLPTRREWQAGEFPFYVYTGEDIYSTEGRKLLPRMLTLAGHYDRAARYLPECWSASPLDVSAFLSVSQLEAHQVFTELRMTERKRRAQEQQKRITYKHDNLHTVERIRMGLALRAMGESDFDLRDVARLVEFTGPVL